MSSLVESEVTSQPTSHRRKLRTAFSGVGLAALGVVGLGVSVHTWFQWGDALSRSRDADSALSAAEDGPVVRPALDAALTASYVRTYGEHESKAIVSPLEYGVHLNLSEQAIIDLCIDGLTLTTKPGDFVKAFNDEAACQDLGAAQLEYDKASAQVEETEPTGVDNLIVAGSGVVFIAGAGVIALGLRRSSTEA